MKKHLFALFLLLAMLISVGFAAAEALDSEAPDPETTEDSVIATVNGEALLSSDYTSVETTYLLEYANMGLDLSDEAVKAYVQDLALTAAIENMLVRQDMAAQGFLTFDEETERWIAEQGKAAYESALADVGDVLRAELELSEDDDVTPYALSYAALLGVTEEDYADVYRTQLATVYYNDWLTQDIPVTDEEIQAAYEAYVAENGDAELTDELRDALAASLYEQRCQTRLSERIDTLAASAEVVYP
ncbi:MAG: hypothetical protein Q4G52_10635, partial [Clostridia bacterium]|nr:hypothetical protein [Clostridia bacterium]